MSLNNQSLGKHEYVAIPKEVVTVYYNTVYYMAD